MKMFLPDLVRKDGLKTGALNLEGFPTGCKTMFISITGQDGSGKTSLRDGLANYFSDAENMTVVTAKSPCDPYIVKLLNNAISQNGYEDWYTEQLLFSFADGLLSNYMVQLNGRCDLFICQRGPIDQYAHGITRSGTNYATIYENQKPERLAKFDMYIHMNCRADVAWKRVCDDEGKDRYEYPEYFERQVKNTEKLFMDITQNVNEFPELDFLRSSKHLYYDTTKKTIVDVLLRGTNDVQKFLKENN